MAVSEERECLLRDWKLPPSSASDVFEVSSCLGFIPDWTVHTVEGEVVLHKEISSSPIFPHQRKRWHQIMGNICLQVGMITVGLKPYKLGTDLSATIFFRDMRTAPAYIHDFVTAESSLSDGPIYFSYYPPFGFSMFDVVEALNIDVKIDRKMRWDESMTLMYKFHYKVLKKFPIDIFVWPSRPPLGEDGRPLSFVTNTINNAERNNKDDVEVLRLKKLVMDRIAKSAAENNLLSYGGGASLLPARNTGLLDWRETGEEHVLKVDVPGFKREDVRVEEAVVEGLRVLEINGNRSQEEEEGGENDRWHCMERSRGKFLRRVRLPEDVKMDKMKAAVENGVLTVIVPKKVEYIEHSYMSDDD